MTFGPYSVQAQSVALAGTYLAYGMELERHMNRPYLKSTAMESGPEIERTMAETFKREMNNS